MACCTQIALAALLLGSLSSETEDSPSDAQGDGRAAVNYARDVRPILSDHCFACHGPDDQKRKAGLRLDTKDGAFSKLKSDNVAIVAGKPELSELIDRIENDDPELLMPPKKSGKPLSAAQIAILRRWVEQGAPTKRTGRLRRRSNRRCRLSRMRPGRSPKSTASSWRASKLKGFRLDRRPTSRP